MTPKNFNHIKPKKKREKTSKMMMMSMDATLNRKSPDSAYMSNSVSREKLVSRNAMINIDMSSKEVRFDSNEEGSQQNTTL